MTRVLLVLTALAASSAFGQEQKKAEAEAPSPQPTVQRIVQVKHVSPDRLRKLLDIFGLHIQSDPQLNTIALSGPPENVKAAEDAIRRLDVPPTPQRPSPNVESTFYIVMASQKDEGSSKLPAELESVVKQLKAVSAYQSYRLVDTIVLRSREGRPITTSGTLPAPLQAPGGPQSGTYTLQIRNIATYPDAKAGHLANITDLSFVAKMPYSTGPNQWQFNDNLIATSVDVREGQKVVIGKANVNGGNSALILVVTVNVVD